MQAYYKYGRGDWNYIFKALQYLCVFCVIFNSVFIHFCTIIYSLYFFNICSTCKNRVCVYGEIASVALQMKSKKFANKMQKMI